MDEKEIYLRTQQVADALGVSVSTVKRYVDDGAMEATRTMGKHRLIPLTSALQFARKDHYPIEGLLAFLEPGPRSAIDETMIETLASALENGRAKEAAAMIASAYRTHQGAVGLADQLIRPVMERVGHHWKKGLWDIYQEHEASRIVTSALGDLITRAARETKARGPLAIGAAPEGDPYHLPGMLGELVLREIGWQVRNLGNNLPLRSLARATLDLRPRLIFLSASHIPDRASFVAEYCGFYEAATQVKAAIIVGGRALDADLRSQIVFAGYGDRMAHLAEFSRHLIPSADTTPDATSNHLEPMDTSN